MGLQEVTGGNKELQRVPRGYKGLEGVTKGCMGFKEIQEVKRGYKGLQGVTEGTKGLQVVTRLVTRGCRG